MSGSAFLERLWALENEERPGFQFQAQANDGTTLRQRFGDAGLMMRHQLAEIAARPDVKDDSAPAFFPYRGTIAVASAFGCAVEWPEDDDPWAKPLIDAAPKAVYDLPEAAVTDGELGKALELTRLMAAAPEGLPIRMTDIQGPLDTAAIMWQQDRLLLAMYESPAEAHHLLQKITRLTIDFVQEQRRLVNALGRAFIPCHFRQVWMPEDAGIALSDDSMALLSPPLYEQFALPYINQISEAFGGVFLHVCGSFVQNLVKLDKVHNLRGLDFAASEQAVEPVFEALAGKVVLTVRLGLNREIPFASIPAFVDHVLAKKRSKRGLFLIINTWYDMPDSGEPWQPEQADEIVRRIRGVAEAPKER